jgi:hypothetical protein
LFVLTRVSKGGDAAEDHAVAGSVLFDVCSTYNQELGEEKHVQDI